MPMFKVEMIREIVTKEIYRTEIEANSIEEAETKADDLASEMNSHCPDDIEDAGYLECRSWDARSVEAVDGEVPLALAGVRN